MAQKNKKKILSKILLVIIVAAILLIVGVTVIPKLTAKPYYFSYSENDDGTYSVAISPQREKNSKSVNIIKIPSEHDGKPITRVKNSGNGGISNEINEIIVPDSVKTIDYNAFGEIVHLKKLTLPSTLQEIGGFLAQGTVELNFQSNEYFTFENGCIIKKSTNTAVYGVDGCTIPDSVSIIGKGAFETVKIANTTLPAGIIKISDLGFFSSTFNFEKLVLTDNIKEIGNEAFSYATGFNETLQISTSGSIHCYAFSRCKISTLIFDVAPKVVGQDKILNFDSKITAYYENENMPKLSNKNQIESDLPGYRKFNV